MQRAAGTDRDGTVDGATDGAHRQRTKSEEEKVSYYKGCVKKKGNKNTARARSAPTYTKSRRPARRLSHLAEHQKTIQTLLHAHRSSSYPRPRAQSPRRAFYVISSHNPTRNLSCRVSPSLRTALRNFPLTHPHLPRPNPDLGHTRAGLPLQGAAFDPRSARSSDPSWPRRDRRRGK